MKIRPGNRRSFLRSGLTGILAAGVAPRGTLQK